jgi:hypothetical protein
MNPEGGGSILKKPTRKLSGRGFLRLLSILETAQGPLLFSFMASEHFWPDDLATYSPGMMSVFPSFLLSPLLDAADVQNPTL